jgi:putative ABC transport system permease protein
MSVAGVRAALRIARRDAVRAKGRSALVVAMIGLPMLGLAFADVGVRTAQLPREEVARRQLGAADLVAELVSSGPIQQRGSYDYSSKESMGGGGRPPAKVPDVAAALPPGSRVTERSVRYVARLRGGGERIALGEVWRLDLDDEMSDGLVHLRKGALPRGAGEAAITTRLADDLGIGLGDPLTLEPKGPTFRVSAFVVLPSSLATSAAVVPASATLPGVVPGASVEGRTWAVSLPRGVRDLDVLPALNAIGLRVSPRSWILDPPPDPYAPPLIDTEAVGVTVVVVGLATLEIVLLAGTAFAVGARRRQRELALVAATGGDRKDVRRIVLAGGVVLGAAGGAIGAAAGIAAVPLATPLLERLSGQVLGPLDVRPLEIAAIVAVGTVTALLAAVLPAYGAARQPVVAALTGRRTEARARIRVPYVALVAIVAGAALAFWAAGDGKVPAAAVEGEGLVTVSGRPANFTLVLVGAVLAELGFVACAPALVGLVGRLARRLPLSLRLAARDAARHRTRSGPATAAVVAAVAGSVALSVYVASDTERQRREYTPRMSAGSVWIGRSDSANPVPERDVTAAAAALPVRERIEAYDVVMPCDAESFCTHWQLELPRVDGCGAAVECFRGVQGSGQVLVGEPALAAWAMERTDPAVEGALRGGKVVVFDERWIEDGHVVVRGEKMSREGAVVRSRTVRLPAVATTAPPYQATPAAVLTRATARAVRLPTTHTATVLTTTRMPTNGEVAAARGALARTSQSAYLDVERGFERESGLVLLALVLGSSVVTVGATGVATGLAAADSRPDLATLAAVGAAPGVRRRLAMAQAATVALLGSALGILAGLVPAIAIVGARAEVPLAMPWGALATTAVGVPLLAALLMGAVTRSRLPLARRLA